MILYLGTNVVIQKPGENTMELPGTNIGNPLHKNLLILLTTHSNRIATHPTTKQASNKRKSSHQIIVIN
jgi:hypothetical protein